jgi:putative membrane protein
LLKLQLMKKWLLFSGCMALALAWAGPLAALARDAFFGHMVMHMLVVAVAAPLLALGLAGGRWDLSLRFPAWFAPIPVSLLELAVVWAWHAPLPHAIACHTLAGRVAEQAMFLATGVWLWLAALAGRGGPRMPATSDHLGTSTWGNRTGAGIVGLLLTSMHMTLLGALLALAPRPLYRNHDGFGGLSALEDQQLGGAVMLVVGGIAYLAGGLGLSLRLLSGRSAAGNVRRNMPAQISSRKVR